jgi:hypothetical protein
MLFLKRAILNRTIDELEMVKYHSKNLIVGNYSNSSKNRYSALTIVS